MGNLGDGVEEKEVAGLDEEDEERGGEKEEEAKEAEDPRTWITSPETG